MAEPIIVRARSIKALGLLATPLHRRLSADRGLDLRFCDCGQGLVYQPRRPATRFE